jgi:hypothetical protein
MNVPKTAKRLRGLLMIGLLAALSQPWPALACSVCYGEPDSPASRGLTWAIVMLGVLVVGVLAGVVSFFVAANRHACAIQGDVTSKSQG